MITIYRPYIVFDGNIAFLKARVCDDFTGMDSEMFFSVDKKYARYFCDEVADSFVVAMLVPAAASRQDIMVEAPISEKLYYNLCNYVANMLDIAWSFKISFHIRNLVNIDFHPSEVSTGCSLGIDSMSTIFQHIGDNVPQSYKLTNLTYLNVGSHGGNDLSKAEDAFQKNLVKVWDFASEIGLDVIPINSNMASFYGAAPVFDNSVTFRSVSAILSLQKLYKRYYFASSWNMRDISFRKEDVELYDLVLLPFLSTGNTEFLSSESEKDRSQKISEIIDNPLIKKHLFVCLKDIIRNNKQDYWDQLGTLKYEYRNCTRCEKCLRTLLCIDILGSISEYGEIFDIAYYKRIRTLFIVKVIALRKTNPFYSDLMRMAKRKDYPIPFISRILSLFYKHSGKLAPMKHRILEYLNN